MVQIAAAWLGGMSSFAEGSVTMPTQCRFQQCRRMELTSSIEESAILSTGSLFHFEQRTGSRIR
jgi:hypothetical protein